MTDPQAGKQPSSGTDRPVPGIPATGVLPGYPHPWLDASSTKGDTWDRGKQISTLWRTHDIVTKRSLWADARGSG